MLRAYCMNATFASKIKRYIYGVDREEICVTHVPDILIHTTNIYRQISPFECTQNLKTITRSSYRLRKDVARRKPQTWHSVVAGTGS